MSKIAKSIEIGGCQGLGSGGNGYISFWSDENALELDGGGGCFTLQTYSKTNELYVHLRKVDFMVCELYQLKI